jgi:cell division protein FtsB
MIRLFFKILWTQSLLILWIGVLVILGTTWAYVKRDVITTYFINRDLRTQTRTEVQSLKKEIAQQEEKRNSTPKDDSANEKTAREIYHMSKPNEKVLYLEIPGDAPSSTTKPTQATTH